MIKTEDLVKNQISYMKHIKIQSCVMGVILMPKHITWQRQQCVLTNSLIMRYHTGNVYWDVLPNVLVLIFLTRKQMISIPTPVLHFVFTFMIWLHVLQNMAGFRYLTRKVVASVNRIMLQDNQQKYTLEKSYWWRRQQFWMLIQVFMFQKFRSWRFTFLIAFHIPHVKIMGTNHCGDTHRTAFKRRELFQDVFCRCDYDEGVVTIFAH